MKKILKSMLLIVLCFSVFISIMPFFSGNAYAKTKKPGNINTTTMNVNYLDNSIDYSWSKSKNAKKYQIYYKNTSTCFNWKKLCTQKSKHFVAELEPGVVHFFKVRGVNGNKKGKFSISQQVVLNNSSPNPGATGSKYYPGTNWVTFTYVTRILPTVTAGNRYEYWTASTALAEKYKAEVLKTHPLTKFYMKNNEWHWEFIDGEIVSKGTKVIVYIH